MNKNMNHNPLTDAIREMAPTAVFYRCEVV